MSERASNTVCERAREKERESVVAAASTSDCSERLTRTGSQNTKAAHSETEQTKKKSKERQDGERGREWAAEGERERSRPQRVRVEIAHVSAFRGEQHIKIYKSLGIQGVCALLWLLFGILH